MASSILCSTQQLALFSSRKNVTIPSNRIVRCSPPMKIESKAPVKDTSVNERSDIINLQQSYLPRRLFMKSLVGSFCIAISNAVMTGSGGICLAEEGFQIVLGTQIEGERFDPEQFLFEAPVDWVYSPRSVKRSRLLLYTDTYGPNYLYSERWPVFRNSNGSTFSKLEVTVTSSMGRESVEDLGPPGNIEVSTAFGLGDLELADVISSTSKVKEDSTYYHWILQLDEGKAAVVSTISGGAIYTICVSADSEDWQRNESNLIHIGDSFTVNRSGGFLYDTNTRLNRRRNSGKASAEEQSL